MGLEKPSDLSVANLWRQVVEQSKGLQRRRAGVRIHVQSGGSRLVGMATRLHPFLLALANLHAEDGSGGPPCLVARTST